MPLYTGHPEQAICNAPKNDFFCRHSIFNHRGYVGRSRTLTNVPVRIYCKLVSLEEVLYSITQPTMILAILDIINYMHLTSFTYCIAPVLLSPTSICMCCTTRFQRDFLKISKSWLMYVVHMVDKEPVRATGHKHRTIWSTGPKFCIQHQPQTAMCNTLTFVSDFEPS